MLEVVVLAMVADIGLSPELAQNGYAFIGHRASLFERHVEGGGFVLVCPQTHRHDDAARCQEVKRRHFFGHRDGMTEGQHHDARTKFEALRTGRNGCHHGHKRDFLPWAHKMIAQPHGVNIPRFGFINVLKKRRSIRHPMVPEPQANAHFDASHTMPPAASSSRNSGDLPTVL